MSSPRDVLTSILKDHGYSLTAPRLAVFGALEGQEPMNMHELVNRAQDIDRASVYRTVALFEELGIVTRIPVGWKYKLELSDAFTAHHHHMSCTNCKRTIPINETSLERIIEHLARQHSFTVQQHQIELQGLCSDCTKSAVS